MLVRLGMYTKPLGCTRNWALTRKSLLSEIVTASKIIDSDHTYHTSNKGNLRSNLRKVIRREEVVAKVCK